MDVMNDEPSSLAGWTPEEIEATRRWVNTWRSAGEALDRLKREELRQLDALRAIELLCGSADYTVPPRAPKPWSGLIEMQAIFRKARENQID